ncbi:MAG: hypothetical protein DYG87_04355 [Anaerolineae bacterium CFX3]|nr:hypothetical protein [Anaerolineae bacterium CFX3]MCQ3946325.1 hypothetical protein [Anaerolineae bacterium]RIK27709.1 MAG: hypothetical protein DCC54_02330 [Anaerolineae bacterium]WKZ52473.1 MAG: hypothetical protein QY329_06990 [Anaerolineales bacterium]
MRLSDLLTVFKNPRAAAIVGVVLGLLLGLTIGWGIWPVKWTDATPQYLSQRFQEEYLRMTIDSYRNNKDGEAAVRRWLDLGPNAPKLLAAIGSNPGDLKPAWVLEYKDAVEQRVGPITAAPPSDVQPEQPPTATPSAPLGDNKILFIAVGLLLALGVIGGAGYIFFLKPILRGRLPAGDGEVSAARQAQEINKTIEKTDFSGLGLEKPVTQTMTTYVLGDDLYDESFSIDAPNGDFLGEYGVGVSETVGVGEPKKVSSIEVWLFDKNDIKTATKVLMTPHAYNDPNSRARLEAKGELISLQKNKQVVLETATLTLLVTIVDLAFGQGNLPENSFIGRLSLEMAVWPRQK